ncbi:chitobiase/beta-hexosaminidase C-terminal domain-containing protein [Niabella insulamsoli]|uniref:chitobiase/beta-hexosaminidase C-terminal domain-containing protein n=1 Tax=Niabella insulamsoli TaxID=3144874 RepID=UPI0031FDDA6D
MKIYIAMLCSIMSLSVVAQLPATLEEEVSQPFSYFKTSIDQLGFKDCPEAMAVTDGGTFSNAHLAVKFLAGDSLKPATSRVVLPEKGYLPIIGYKLQRNDCVYELKAFSAPEDFKPYHNLITYVQWTISNPGRKARRAQLGFDIIPFYPNAFKNYYRHNMYCTPWYLSQFMDENIYRQNLSQIDYKNGGIYQGNHLIVQTADMADFKAMKADSLRWKAVIDLAPGASKTLLLKIPFVPVNDGHPTVKLLTSPSNFGALKKSIANYWDKELNKIDAFSFPEKKIMDMYKSSFINMLIARDIMEDKKSVIQRCNEFQYDYFYVRDNAYFARVYDMLGLHEDAREILLPYFIKDAEGNDLQFQQRTGIYKKLCFDYWGQVLWAFGSHYRQTKDRDLLERAYKLIPNHMQDFESMIALDSRGLWPRTWPYDNEHIDGHYTGHNFWVILGLRNAIYMASEMKDQKNLKKWQGYYDQFKKNFERELEQIVTKTDGYIPPGMDDPELGFDWANASAGLYPFEAIDKNNPAVKKTLDMVRNYNYQEGISTYSGCNAYVARKKALNNETLPERGLHHYETFYVANGNLVVGAQQKCIEDLYSVMVHTSSTHAGFEWRPTPWGNRDFGINRAPHGWLAARYIEFLRNMVVREEGNDLHLLSAISPEWAKRGDNISIKSAATYFGTVNMDIHFVKDRMFIKLNNDLNMDEGKIWLHIPWFITAKKIVIDGADVPVTKTLALSSTTKEVVIYWDDSKRPAHLNFQTGVALYLNKYYNRPATANYNSLFPTLAMPGYIKNEDKKTISLFSPDNYADIYYTVDGTNPDKNAQRYKRPIPITFHKKTIIKAVCIDQSGEVSDCRTIVTD